MRYLPPKGTAGLARSLVSGYSRVPFPPASTKASTRTCMTAIVSRGSSERQPVRDNKFQVDRDQTLGRLRERILRYAASHLSRDLAEDLAQEVLLVLHEKYP